jgi:hypothetical protein
MAKIKSKPKIEDVFLSYANNILKGHPENFHIIVETIRQNIDMDIDLDGIDEVIDYICKISQYPDPTDVYNNLNDFSDGRGGLGL